MLGLFRTTRRSKYFAHVNTWSGPCSQIVSSRASVNLDARAAFTLGCREIASAISAYCGAVAYVRFREKAPARLEPWFEVIFWKLASQKLIRNGTTHSMAIGLQGSTTAEQLWRACRNYTQAGSRPESRACFEALHRLFNLTTRSIATVATFPAFLDPDHFPMVDTRIAKWVARTMDAHNRVDPSGPQLIPAKSMNVKGAVLTMSDFDFMYAWTHWCRHAATKLTARSPGSLVWRARDVEMAVFRAWGDRNMSHPEIDLPPLPAQG